MKKREKKEGKIMEEIKKSLHIEEYLMNAQSSLFCMMN